MRKMDKILIIIGITTLLFILTCFVFAWFDKIVPAELIMGYFGLIGAECGFMSWIKTAGEKVTRKIKKEKTK